MSPTIRAYVIDPLERAGRTFIQQFTVLLLAAPAAGLLVQQNWLAAVDSAVFAAIISLITSVITFKVPVLPVWADLLLRVLKTGLQSFLATLVAGKILTISGADWQGALGVAIPVMLAAFLTGLAALGVPSTNGASLLPAGTAVAIDDSDDVDPDGDTEEPDGMFAPYEPEVTVQPLTAAEGLPRDPDTAGAHASS